MNGKLEEKKVFCNSLEDLPSLSDLESFERGIEYIFIFGEEIESQKMAVGNEWKEKVSKFVITIHATEPKIKLVKLITDKEIEDNQELFEKYARDYKELSTKLIYQLAEKFNLKIEKPVMEFLGKLRRKKQVGKMGDWKYGIHGHHCRFENTKTGQVIETPFSFELEFGVLDGYFFLRYIDSTPTYKPLNFAIYQPLYDYDKILDKMVELGRFEYIEGAWKNKGVVVKPK